MRKQNYIKHLLAATALFNVATMSHAALVQAGTMYNNGSGFGNVNTVLTLANNNGTGLTNGSVGWDGAADVTSGNTAPGASKNATFSFGDLNITSAGDLIFVFNATEPGNAAANGVTLESLILSIYSDMGGPSLFTASLASPVVFSETENGTGSAGYSFVLDATDMAAAQLFVSANNRIGLAASLSDATAGADTFYVAVRASEVPEPGSIALLAMGLAGAWAARKRSDKG